MEDKVNRIIKELEDSVNDLYPGELIEKASKDAIELIKELEDIRQIQILSIRAAHEVIHTVRKVIEDY